MSADDKALEIKIIERQLKNATRDLNKVRKAAKITSGEEKRKYQQAIINLKTYIRQNTLRLIKLDDDQRNQIESAE